MGSDSSEGIVGREFEHGAVALNSAANKGAVNESAVARAIGVIERPTSIRECPVHYRLR
jgi:hypothetical protein